MGLAFLPFPRVKHRRDPQAVPGSHPCAEFAGSEAALQSSAPAAAAGGGIRSGAAAPQGGRSGGSGWAQRRGNLREPHPSTAPAEGEMGCRCHPSAPGVMGLSKKNPNRFSFTLSFSVKKKKKVHLHRLCIWVGGLIIILVMIFLEGG